MPLQIGWVCAERGHGAEVVGVHGAASVHLRAGSGRVACSAYGEQPLSTRALSLCDDGAPSDLGVVGFTLGFCHAVVVCHHRGFESNCEEQSGPDLLVKALQRSSSIWSASSHGNAVLLNAMRTTSINSVTSPHCSTRKRRCCCCCSSAGGSRRSRLPSRLAPTPSMQTKMPSRTGDLGALDWTRRARIVRVAANQ